MHSLTKSELLQQAYRQTDKCSLLYYNCGDLCGGACCKSHAVSGDVTYGMTLLPEEEKLCTFDGAKIFDSTDGKILVCSQKCDRSMRPFMCRLFPYYAKITFDKQLNRKRISLIPDPRALRICPVARKANKVCTSVYFRRYTKRAVRILIQDKKFENIPSLQIIFMPFTKK